MGQSEKMLVRVYNYLGQEVRILKSVNLKGKSARIARVCNSIRQEERSPRVCNSTRQKKISKVCNSIRKNKSNWLRDECSTMRWLIQNMYGYQRGWLCLIQRGECGWWSNGVAMSRCKVWMLP